MGRRLVAVIIVSALGVGACSSGDDGAQANTVGEQSPTSVAGDGGDGEGTDGRDDPVEPASGIDRALADVGVEIRGAGDRPLDTASGLELTSFQIGSMERQLDAGGGVTGAALDEMLGSPGGLPVSFLLAAWVSTAPTPAAVEAAALIGEQQWNQAPSIVFPSAVLALFAADATAAGAGGATAEGLAAPGHLGSIATAGMRAGSATSGVCSELTDWFGSILDFLFESLKADTDGFFGFLAEIWNAAIDLARATIGGVIEVLTAPLVAIIADVIGVIGTLSMVTSLLVPWSAELTETDPRPAFAVGGEPDIAQRFTVSIDTNIDVEWPSEVEDCAAVAGFNLPDPSEGVGSPVDWTVVGLPPNGIETGRETEIDDGNRATFDWITGREESSEGEEAIGVVAATATITSTQIGELRSMLQALLAGFVPVAPFGEIVGEMFVDLAGPVFDRFAELIQVSGSTSVRVVHHEPPATEETTPPATTPPPAVDMSAVDPCTIISFEEAGLALLATPARTQFTGESVSFSGFGGVGCRYYAQYTERLDHHLSVQIAPDGDGRLDAVAGWNPWGYWDVVPLDGVGDEAWMKVANGSSEYGSPAGTIYAVGATQSGVLVVASVSAEYPAGPDGLSAIVQLALDRATAGG